MVARFLYQHLLAAGYGGSGAATSVRSTPVLLSWLEATNVQ
jgi:hypothetical protein